MPKLKAGVGIIRDSKYFLVFIYIFFLSYSSIGQTVNIYTSPNGASVGSGQTASAPVSLNQARAIAKANPQRPCTIWLATGAYPQLILDAADTRSSIAPAIYQSIVPNGATFEPETALNIKNFQPIPDSIKVRIINATAKTKVMQMPLTSLNLPDLSAWPSSFSIGLLKTPKFYNNGYPLAMSRYPSDGTAMTMRQVITKGSANSVPGGSFKYRDGRGQYWLHAINDGGLYLSGNWQYTWQMVVVKTLSLNTSDSLIVQAIGLSLGLGTQEPSRIAAGTEPYYALNLVEEIAAEGQWSINFRTKMLYMWVPATGALSCSGNGGQPAISVTGVNNTRFIGLSIRGGSGNGIDLHNCSSILIAGNHISDCSGNGITITDGANCVVQSNDIDSVGRGGVIISTSSLAADQFNMKLSGHQVINNHIYSYARESPLYSGAVDVSNAMGTYVAYNKVHDCPHVGILYGGNNNTLEYNEVYDVVKKFTDMGAFYRYGTATAWNSRGNKIQHNYIHDAPLANGVYEDGCSSGDSISYNIIAGAVMATYNNSGYFNAYANNVYAQDTYPVTSMTEPSTDAAYVRFYDSLQRIWNGSTLYKAAYPECVDMVGALGRNSSYTSRIWPSVTGNVFVSNPGIVSSIDDSQLFGANGTTNAVYAQSSAVFTKDGIVFRNDLKLTGKLSKTLTPFRVDSLKTTGAFGLTGGLDWHVNRIGLHRDSYRTDVSATQTAGINPVLTFACKSNNNFVNPQIISFTVGVKSPNAANTLPSVWFNSNGAVFPGLAITKKIVSYDSVVYLAEWINPRVGPYQVSMTGGDGQYWIYTSNAAVFTVKNSSTTALPVVTDPVSAGGVALEWSAPNELNVGSYQVLSSTDGFNFRPISQVTAKCNDSNLCEYHLPVVQNPNQPYFYRVQVMASDDSSQMTNTVRSQLDPDSRELALFPNPVKDVIHVNYQSANGHANTNLVVYDMLGRVMLKNPMAIREGLNEMVLSVGNFANGIYLLVMEDPGERILTRSFVIRH